MGVDLEEERVGVERVQGVRLGCQGPVAHPRPVHVGAVVVHLAPEARPVAGLGVLDQLRQLVGVRVVLVELLHVVRRGVEAVVEGRAVRARPDLTLHQDVVGRVEREAPVQVVDHGELDDVARHRVQPLRLGSLMQDRVQVHVLPGEPHVLHGHRGAVRPLQALAVAESVGPAVLADLEESNVGEVLHLVGVLLVPVVPGHPRAGPAGPRDPASAAVVSDAVRRRDHLDLFGQPLLDRGKLSGLHHLGEAGVLAELRRPGAGVLVVPVHARKLRLRHVLEVLLRVLHRNLLGCEGGLRGLLFLHRGRLLQRHLGRRGLGHCRRRRGSGRLLLGGRGARVRRSGGRAGVGALVRAAARQRRNERERRDQRNDQFQATQYHIHLLLDGAIRQAARYPYTSPRAKSIPGLPMRPRDRQR